MAWTYDSLTVAVNPAAVDKLVHDNDERRFIAAEEKKAIKVRAGISESTRALLIQGQDKILADCLRRKPSLMVMRGTPMADPTQWGYTNAVFPNSERQAWRANKILSIETEYFNVSDEIDKWIKDPNPLLDTPHPANPAKTKRQFEIDQRQARLVTLEAEKAERLRDTSTPLAA